MAQRKKQNKIKLPDIDFNIDKIIEMSRKKNNKRKKHQYQPSSSSSKEEEEE